MVHFDIMVMSFYLMSYSWYQLNIGIIHWNIFLTWNNEFKNKSYTHPIAYVHMLHKLQYLPTAHSEDSAMKLVIWYRYNICDALCIEL